MTVCLGDRKEARPLHLRGEKMRAMRWAAVVTLAGVLASHSALAKKPSHLPPPKESEPTVVSQNQDQNQRQRQRQTQSLTASPTSTATTGSNTNALSANVSNTVRFPRIQAFLGGAVAAEAGRGNAPCTLGGASKNYVGLWAKSEAEVIDSECLKREDARLLIEAGRPDLAVYLLVGQEIPVDAIEPQRPPAGFHVEPSTCPTCQDCSEQARRALVACNSK